MRCSKEYVHYLVDYWLNALFFIQIFPHPRRFFGFNTSCFWQRKVLYLCRDMGGASAPPFFRHFPFKIGDLGAHPEKICLPLIFICLPQILIRGRQSNIMRRVGKIGRRKVFSKVKNVNVQSLKSDSKLLDFFGAQEWRVASPPIAIFCFTFLTFVTYVTFITYVTFVTNVTYDSLHSCSKFHSHHSRSKSRSRDSCSKQDVGFCVELYSFFCSPFIYV